MTRQQMMRHSLRMAIKCGRFEEMVQNMILNTALALEAEHPEVDPKVIGRTAKAIVFGVLQATVEPIK